MIIVANCNSSHLTNSLTCLNYLKNKFNKTDNEKRGNTRMIEALNTILKKYVINFPIYELSVLLNFY